MNRRLIIIANTGGTGNYCESVIYDRENYLAFFQSPEGGYWNECEIFAPETNCCNLKMLSDYIEEEKSNAIIDYWLVVFVGHGWENDKFDTRIELYPYSRIEEDLPIGWFREIFADSRCLFIADCCRSKLKIVTESVSINTRKLMTFSDTNNIGYNLRCRHLYNYQIMKLNKGLFQIGYAASHEEEAGNMPDDNGGLYSYNLLQEARLQINLEKATHNNSIISFSYIHSKAKKAVIEQSHGDQTPQLIYNRGYQPPFCVIPE